MNSDFKDLISLFNQYGVRYLVVGGYAVMLYAEPRMTKDIDFAIASDAVNLEAFRRAFTEFGFPLSDQAAADLALPNKMISVGRPPTRIDILNQIEGVDFERAWIARHSVSVEGIEIHFISKPDLIAAKRAAGRPQDLVDLIALGDE